MAAVAKGMPESAVLQLSGGGTFGYREYGDPAGRPLVFFHGWPGSSPQGSFLHGPALERKIRIISVDRPGFGRSSRLPGRDFLHLPPLVDELAAELKIDRFDVMGMSGGGPYALACAWALPHRVRAAVVCCGAPPLDTPEARRHFSGIYRGLIALNERFPALVRALLAPATLASRIRPPHLLLRMAAVATGPRDRLFLGDRERFAEFYPAFRESVRAGSGAWYEDGRCYAQPWPFEVAEIRVPVRIWHGSQDRNFHHSLAERLAARIPGAAFFLREEGHYSLPAFHREEMLTDLLEVSGKDRP